MEVSVIREWRIGQIRACLDRDRDEGLAKGRRGGDTPFVKDVKKIAEDRTIC